MSDSIVVVQQVSDSLVVTNLSSGLVQQPIQAAPIATLQSILLVSNPITTAIQSGLQGPPGPQGPAGPTGSGTGSTNTFIQQTAPVASGAYLWAQTFANHDLSMWVEDGLP